MSQSLEQAIAILVPEVDEYIGQLSYDPATECAILCDMFSSKEDINHGGYHTEDFLRESSLASESGDLEVQIAAIDCLVRRWPQLRQQLIDSYTGV